MLHCALLQRRETYSCGLFVAPHTTTHQLLLIHRRSLSKIPLLIICWIYTLYCWLSCNIHSLLLINYHLYCWLSCDIHSLQLINYHVIYILYCWLSCDYILYCWSNIMWYTLYTVDYHAIYNLYCWLSRTLHNFCWLQFTYWAVCLFVHLQLLKYYSLIQTQNCTQSKIMHYI